MISRNVQKIRQNQRLLFLSDAHLGSSTPQINRTVEKELISVIDYAESMDMRIFILGDLFDYWLEYPGQVPEIAPVLLERFRRYNRKHPGTLYITGNHDNWTDYHFRDLGFDVEPEYRILDAGGRKTLLLLHGDGLSDPAFGLPRSGLHRLLRNSYFIYVYKKILPARAGFELMRWYSRISRLLKPEWIKEKDRRNLDAWVERQLKSGLVDVVICGHHHKPVLKTFDNRTYMNTGSFFDDRSAGLYCDGTFRLVCWDEESKKFVNGKSKFVYHT